MDPRGGKWPTQEEQWRILKEERIQSRLNQRKQMIARAIYDSRFKTANPISGYDLSAFRKRRKKKTIKCWTCGKTGHTSKSCRSMKITKIQRQIGVLLERIEYLETALTELNISAAKLERKRHAKIKKIKKKKHKEKVEGMNKAVTMKVLLNKDEVFGLEAGTPKYLTEALNFHQSLKPRMKIRVEKEYRDLFGESLREKIMDAIDLDDAIEEYLDTNT